MKLKITFLIFCLFFKVFIHGQQNSELFKDYIPKLSADIPANYNFYDYTKEGSVNTLTGSFGLTIPIYTIKTPYLDIPIQLNYSTNGVKLNSISNETGINWSILAGAEITRIVNKIPDDREKTIVRSNSNIYDDANITNFPYQKFDPIDVRPSIYNNLFPKNQFQFFEKNTQTGVMIKGAGNGTCAAFYVNEFPKSMNNFFFPNNSVNTEVECFNEMNYRESGIDSEKDVYEVDSELDYFKVNLNGQSFTFIIKKTDNTFYNLQHPNNSYSLMPNTILNVFEAVCLDDIGYKINMEYAKIPFYYSNNKKLGRWMEAVAIVKFTITDKKGIKYIFDKLVLNDNEYLREYYNRFTASQPNYRFMQLKMFDTSADNWKLSKIILPNSDEITYTYVENKYSFSREITRQHDGEYLNKPYNLQPSKPNYGFDKVETYVTDYSLKEIKYNGQSIKFNYTNARPDLLMYDFTKPAEDYRRNLSQINISNPSGKIIRKFDFTKTFYYYQDNDESHEYSRMFLTKIEDSANERSYVFEYDSPEKLFARNDVRAHDLYGYCNGNTTYNFPSFPKLYINLDDNSGNKISYSKPISANYFETAGVDRSPNTVTAKYGTLKKVYFKTGGILEVDYENNTFFDERLFSTKELGPGVRVNSLKYYSSTKLEKRIIYSYDDFNDGTHSSGRLLYKPSYAYFKNHSFNNEFDKSSYETKGLLDITNYDHRLEYNAMNDFDNYFSRETLEKTTSLSQSAIAKKMIHLSNYSLGATSDIYGRELVYTNVSMKLIDVANSSNNTGETRYTYYYNDNRGFVGGVTGFRTDDSYMYTLGTDETPKMGSSATSFFAPYWRPDSSPKLVTSKGFIEKDAKEIFPFPERNFFENLENARFGKLQKVEFYNNSNQLVSSEEYTYDYVKKPSVNNNFLSNIKRNYLKLHQYYDNDPVNKKFARLYSIYAYLTYTLANYQNWNGLHLFNINKLSYNSKIDIKNKKSINYFSNDKTLENNVTYNYDTDNGNILEIIKTGSNLDQYKTAYVYPHGSDDGDLLDVLWSKNMISEPYIIRNLVNNEVKLTTKKSFLLQNSLNFPLLSEVRTSKTDYSESAESPQIQIKKYNSKDMPSEILTKEGLSVVYLYGYDKTAVVAKIENMLYSSIPPSLISNIEVASSSSGSETALLSALAALRIDPALSGAMVTTYTYVPLVGLSTITDPKGDRMTYTYDSVGRLEFVKDKLGNILSENQYNYKQ